MASGADPWASFPRPLAWTVVVALNVYLPLGAALSLEQPGVMLGMGAAVALVWAVGMAACAHPGPFALVLIRGGFRVGVSQLVPVLQVSAGLLALWTWNIVAAYRPRGPGLEEPTAGFVIALLAAHPLLLAAFVLGGGHRMLVGPADPGAGESPTGLSGPPRYPE